jgi:hypothetical protein
MWKRRPRTLFAMALLLAFSTSASRSENEAPAEFNVVELVPQEPPKWSPTNLFAPITGFFLGGPGYWYGERTVEVETTPPGAILDLFYVRRNFQKRYEQTDAPARDLPAAHQASDRNADGSCHSRRLPAA